MTMRRYRGLCRAIGRLSTAWVWMQEHLAVWGLLLVVLACMVGSLTACSGVRAIPLTREDSTHTAVYHRDTVRLVDSVYTREYQRADTVYRTREVVRYRDRVSLRRDTVYRDRTVVQTLPPERYVPRFYRVCAWVLCGVVVGTLFYLALRFYFRR